MNISLKYNSVDEWVSANLLPIMSYRNSAMVIMQGCPIWLKVLSALGFTVDTVYYRWNINNLPQRCLLGHHFLVVPIVNGDTGRFNVGLVQVQLVLRKNQEIKLIHGLAFFYWKEISCNMKPRRNLICNSWYRVQHSSCGSVTSAKLWLDHHNNLSVHNKLPDALGRTLEDIILHVVRSHGSMVKTLLFGITQKNYQCWWKLTNEWIFTQMVVLHIVILSPFLFANQYSAYQQNGVVGDLPA